ncbi:hypothetical protein TL16_g04546 [Triparma laevis f. inornata]|uniref:ABM domain-containing protein n=2 Tax=Triparma laevis TaxID=1534972 RepID=A0A9W7FQU3_9STRA|nr:hypothetical protein TL16_g04546 [Triparma laevis f. inornata]GMI16529.1 hypothetical protein TrLO_g10787 [Triparma laevis f. longispina]
MSSVLTPFCVNVRLCVIPSRRTEFLNVIRSDQEGTLRDEEGSLQFLVMQDTTNENVFYFHEEYQSESAFQAHMAAPHFAPWRAFTLTDPFESPIEVNLYSATGESQPITRESRTALTPDYATTIKYCVWVNLFPKSSVKTSFVDCIAQNKLGTDSNEPNALQYTWGQNSKDDSKYNFFEIYQGEEGFKEHASADHFKTWEEFAGAEPTPFEKDPEVFFARVI